ncbi:MAG: class I SAM-dependent DNA methyltransferase [Hyphomicrobiales bacterium]|nr:class I SAM-dependent DNA methyltransferase [Hyphomicrobiales bacterium]
MTPQDFIAKWRTVELKERTASQSHFNDLCRLLEILDPVTADPKGTWFTFEKGASKTSGGEGWADVWRENCFAWEYKGRRKDLDQAFSQLQQYAIALDNPPLLIVSDMDRIRIHTNWTNTVHKIYTINLEDLTDAASRDLLRNAFLDPERLKPEKTRQLLTEEAAEQFAGLAQRLRERGHDAEQVAHFVNRLVFCMFAEDVGLLPNRMFERMLKHCHQTPADFEPHARTLFGAMKNGGMVGFEKVDWFNGGLFDNDHAFPLLKPDVEDLITAAKLDWSDVDPSILGTLFERGLDPSKRSQLGAHYTDRGKIMQIVNPVIVEPLMAEWAGVKQQIIDLLDNAPKETKEKLLRGPQLSARTRAHNAAEELHRAFLERLKAFRVLDPACGSGNFLYLALLELKNIEHRTNLEAEALGLARAFPTIGPESVLGIELNSYAAELARVSVWIGEIQWMRRNGFNAARNPILRTLDTIENRDAVLAPDGTRAEWPKADVVIGNPPFLGASKILGELGDEYTTSLRDAWGDSVPGFADLVCYWFAKAWAQMQSGQLIRAGLVSTNSIRGGANREVLRPIVESGRIFAAWSDEPWTVNGAAVRVSIICFDMSTSESSQLDGVSVKRILSDLTANDIGFDLTTAQEIKTNIGICIRGIETGGPFEFAHDQFQKLVTQPINPNGMNNSQVLKRILNGNNILKRQPDRYAIDFTDYPESSEACLFEAPFAYLQSAYSNYGKNSKRKFVIREDWWRHRRTGAALRKATAGLDRFIVTPRVGKYRIFTWLAGNALADSATFVIARDDDTSFGILHSSFHEFWALRMGTSLEDRPRYTSSSTFETFPFPEGLTPNIPASDYAADPRARKIAAAAARLNELRENWLNPADLVKRVPEVVPGYPDRILPVSELAEKELKKRTLTNLYNARPAWLDNAHKALDEAVAEAYGWGDDWRSGKLTEDEILARLFRLNQERSSAA